ncbi:MAG: CDP-diacylglycerol--glycerol-3-phosphate 3-phosphatidyltransferase [Candidatus Spyradosoma sp.]
MKHLPNILTLSRIPLLFVIVGLLCVGGFAADVVAFAVFLIAAFSDWLDGYIARRVGAVSNFGKLMDALTDKIIMVGLFVSLLGLKWTVPAGAAPETLLPQYCVFFVIIIICREFLITGLRLVAASNGLVLAAERAGKLKTALQMVSVSLLLLARALASADAPAVDSWALLTREAGLWAFYGAVALTIYSGTGYIIRNWKILQL